MAGQTPDAMRKLAKEKGVLLIDLNMLSKELFEPVGLKRSNDYGPMGAKGPDRIHLNNRGSEAVGQLVMDDLKQIVPSLADIARQYARICRVGGAHSTKTHS